jgi:hypothetical protein
MRSWRERRGRDMFRKDFQLRLSVRIGSPKSHMGACITSTWRRHANCWMSASDHYNKQGTGKSLKSQAWGNWSLAPDDEPTSGSSQGDAAGSSRVSMVSRKVAWWLTHLSIRGALVKLLAFSISLAVIPISTYFLSSKYLWEGGSPNLFHRS